MIDWKNVRKERAVFVGTKRLGEATITWTIKKSIGGLSYQLFLGDAKGSPLYSFSTADECKRMADVYL